MTLPQGPGDALPDPGPVLLGRAPEATRFRGDDLSLITFGRHAQTVELGELVGLEGVYMQGTNLHHALLLARERLARQPDATPVVLASTNRTVLRIVPLEALRQHAVDVPPDAGSLAP